MADRDDILAGYNRPEPSASSTAGLLAPGNLDLAKRPLVRNPDGTISTVRSMSVNFGNGEVLIPTVSDDGRILSNEDAIAQYQRSGGHLGIFDTPENATTYAEQLHLDQQRMYQPRANGGGVDDILAQYGAGYVPPQFEQGDGEIASTRDILNQYSATERMDTGIPGFLRRMGQRLRGVGSTQERTPVNTLTGREAGLQAREQHANPALYMAAEGADTMGQWIDMHPGVDRGQSRPQDLLAPLGMAAMAPLTAVRGSVGVFGGRLARTADREALSRAEEMAARGTPRDDIWSQTGWFQGRDGQWRFEIDDSHARLTPQAAGVYEAQNPNKYIHGARLPDVMEHRALTEAYPSTEDTRASAFFTHKPAGASYHPAVDQMSVSAGDANTARAFTLHELQHAVQQREGFTSGASPDDFVYQNSPLFSQRRSYEEPEAAYRRVAGEVEARNVESRRDLSPEARRVIPPWQSQDVPDADQILRQYGQGPQMSASLPMDEAARLARAQEQGYTTAGYRGSTAVSANDLGPTEDLSRLTGVTQPKATFFGSQPEQANAFTRGLAGGTPDGAGVYRALLNTEGFRVVDWPEYAGQTRWTAHDMARLLSEADAQGAPGVTIRGMTDAGGGAEQYGILDLSRARSVNAAFDPARRGSTDFLAADTARSSLPGVVASGAEGAARAEADRILQQYTKGPPSPETPTWYHGTSDPNLQSFSAETAGGSRNSGGHGAVFLTPFRTEAESVYGPHVLSVESAHQRPFVWDLGNLPETLQRGREVMPELRVHGDSWLDQPAFFDALRRAGYDAVEMRGRDGPAELAVLDPRLLHVADRTKGGEADRILSQYSKGPSEMDTTKAGRGSGRGQGAGTWRTLEDAPADELVQARVRYRPEPHPEPWNDGTHIIGAQRRADGTWADRQGNQVWPIEWRPFKPKRD